MIIFSTSATNKGGPRAADSTYWIDRDPYPDCGDCKGSGSIDIGQGDIIECPCTMEMVSPDDNFGLALTGVFMVLIVALIWSVIYASLT